MKCRNLSRYPLMMSAAVLLAPSTLRAQHGVEEIQVIATPQDRRVAELAQSVTVIGG